jgi:uncharacterized membrane protein
VSETGTSPAPDGGRKRRVPAWLTYTLLRLLFFAVPLVIVYLLGGNIVIAAFAAAIIGVCLSVIFLYRQRTQVAADLDAWRTARRSNRAEPTDEDVEDAVAGDGQNANAAASPKP